MDDKAGHPPHDFYIHPNLLEPKINEIDETNLSGIGVSKINPLTIPADCLLDLKSGGVFTFDITLTCYFWIEMNKKFLGNPKLRQVTFHFYLYVNNTAYEIGSGYNGNINGKNFGHQLAVSRVLDFFPSPTGIFELQMLVLLNLCTPGLLQ